MVRTEHTSSFGGTVVPFRVGSSPVQVSFFRSRTAQKRNCQAVILQQWNFCEFKIMLCPKLTNRHPPVVQIGFITPLHHSSNTTLMQIVSRVMCDSLDFLLHVPRSPCVLHGRVGNSKTSNNSNNNAKKRRREVNIKIPCPMRVLFALNTR